METGSVTRSRGFLEKVVNNPHINHEGRNQGLVFFSDGIPYFKDRGTNRKGYPCAVRLANATSTTSKKLSMTHMLVLMPCEYYGLDERTGKYTRQLRSPLSLEPMMLRVADELYGLYHTGVRIVDFSLHENNLNRVFIMRCILLYWIGDYPGLGEVSFFKYVYAYVLC